MYPNKLISNFSRRKAAEFRRRFAMTRPYPVCGHAVARRAKVVSGGSGEFRCHSLHSAQILTQVNAAAWQRLRICDQCRLNPLGFIAFKMPLEKQPTDLGRNQRDLGDGYAGTSRFCLKNSQVNPPLQA